MKNFMLCDGEATNSRNARMRHYDDTNLKHKQATDQITEKRQSKHITIFKENFLLYILEDIRIAGNPMDYQFNHTYFNHWHRAVRSTLVTLQNLRMINIRRLEPPIWKKLEMIHQ